MSVNEVPDLENGKLGLQIGDISRWRSAARPARKSQHGTVFVSVDMLSPKYGIDSCSSLSPEITIWPL